MKFSEYFTFDDEISMFVADNYFGWHKSITKIIQQKLSQIVVESLEEFPAGLEAI